MSDNDRVLIALDNLSQRAEAVETRLEAITARLQAAEDDLRAGLVATAANANDISDVASRVRALEAARDDDVGRV